MNASLYPKSQIAKIIPGLMPMAALFLALTTAPAHADWPNTNATKWVQYPDLNGLDVFAAQPPAGQPGPGLPIILADDFPCTNTGPVTDIHIWASWIGDQPVNVPITLGIWSDVPASPANTFSHPGTNLWSQTFVFGQYTYRLWTRADEPFWSPDPPPNGSLLGSDTVIWQYNFYPDPASLFVQQGMPTAPTNYWLSVTAGTNQVPFGWKTSTNHYNDDAVFGHLGPGGQPLGDWLDMHDPRDSQISLDMSFALTTRQPTNPPCCPETNVVKFLQRPNVTNGLDVLASYDLTLADDFLCTNSGPITDIHIWGSWNFDNVDTNTSFTLGIWSDVPAVTNAVANRIPSHPGAQLWSQSFAPGEYAQCLYTNGYENFYDPSATNIMGFDTNMYYLCFFPTNPFFQQGSVAFPTNYWLSVNAQPSPTTGARLFGWKTSSDKYNDDAVWFKGPGLPPPTAWNEMFDAQGQSLNLAFKITTVTNCPLPISSLTASLATNTVTITWTNGVLQQADTVLGPWMDVPAAVSPYSFTVPSSPPYRFYRARCKL